MATSNIPVDIWETRRAVITRLYKDEEWPLKQVIKMIETTEFRPSETQVRARLKKWKITKPSRKKYAGERRCPTENKCRRKRSWEDTQGYGVSPSSPTPEICGQPEHESPPPKEVPNGPSIPQLDLLETAFNGYFLDPDLLPVANDTQPIAPVVSSCCAANGTVEPSATPDHRPWLGLDLFSPSMHSYRWPRVATEPAGSTPPNQLCVAADENNGLDALPTTDTLHPDVDNNPIHYKECAPYSRLLTQGHLGLALCKHVMPRIAQQDRLGRLQSTTGQPTQYGLREACPDPFCAPYFPPMSQFTPPMHEGQRLCLACRDFSRL